MRRIKLTGENAKIETRLRKKLFVAGGYLAVSFALLILVSYGQYRIKFDGTAYMPEAAGIEACLKLDKNLAATVDFGSYLTDLQPGDSARTYASAYSTNEGDATALNHMIRVTIENSSTTTTGEGNDQTTTTVASDLGLDYTLRIFSTPGRVPMQFIMIDDSNNNKKYISKRQSDGKEYRFYLISGSGDNETVSANEIKFTLPASNTAGNTYRIFVGWDNTAENATSLTDAAFRKEVELLELRAEVVAEATQSGIKSESELQAAIPVPSPSPSPTPTPTPVPTEPVG